MDVSESDLSRWLSRDGHALISAAAGVARRLAQRRFRGPQVLLAALEAGQLDNVLARAGVENAEAEERLGQVARRASSSWSGAIDDPELDSGLERTLVTRARRIARALDGDDILDAIISDQVGITVRELADLELSWEAFRREWTRSFCEIRNGADVPELHSAEPQWRATVGDHSDILARYCLDYGGTGADSRGGELLLQPAMASRLAGILGRLTRKSALIVGDAGVGKTALVRALANWIQSKDAPAWLSGMRILSVSCHALAAGVGYRGELDERVQKLIDAGISNRNIILFFDELEALAEASGPSGKGPLGLFHEHLSAGTLRIIAAAPTGGFEAHLRKHDSLLRRFEIIRLQEPAASEVISMLRNRLPALERHYGFGAEDAALEAVVSTCERYMPSRRFPDKAISTIDSAFQRHRERCKEDPERPARVAAAAVLEVVSEETRIPVARLSEMEHARLEGLEAYLRERVYDQGAAILAITLGIQRLRLGLKDSKRTGGAFLCVGPPGTGKTELAKALSEYLMGSESAMIRFNMSEFQTPESYQRLVGAPPGYVGYDEGGELTNKLMDNPYSVVLFDEIEKGASRVFDVLLQVLSDGHLMDSHGKTVDCKNSVFLMTSNAIADASGQDDTSIRRALLTYRDPHRQHEGGPTFRREFIDRLDIIPFDPLSQSTLHRIAAREVAKVLEQARCGDIIACPIEAGPDIISWLVKKIDTETTGARAVQRLVEGTIAREIAQSYIRGELSRGAEYQFVLDEDDGLKIRFRTTGKQGGMS